MLNARICMQVINSFVYTVIKLVLPLFCGKRQHPKGLLTKASEIDQLNRSVDYFLTQMSLHVSYLWNVNFFKVSHPQLQILSLREIQVAIDIYSSFPKKLHQAYSAASIYPQLKVQKRLLPLKNLRQLYRLNTINYAGLDINFHNLYISSVEFELLQTPPSRLNKIICVTQLCNCLQKYVWLFKEGEAKVEKYAAPIKT